jgi:hypothetical protein
MTTSAGSESGLSQVRDPEKALADTPAVHDPQNRDHALQTADNADRRKRQPEATSAQTTKWYSRLDPRRGKQPLLLNTRSSEWLIQLCVGFGVFVDLCSKRFCVLTCTSFSRLTLLTALSIRHRCSCYPFQTGTPGLQ